MDRAEFRCRSLASSRLPTQSDQPGKQAGNNKLRGAATASI